MSKKAIGIIIIVLVFLFPFRWVYLEYPDPIEVRTTMVDGGRIQYVIMFLSVVAGFFAFMLLSTGDDSKH